eukprot:3694598-Alexandrium_andersonii.AAC.1
MEPLGGRLWIAWAQPTTRPHETSEQRKTKHNAGNEHTRCRWPVISHVRSVTDRASERTLTYTHDSRNHRRTTKPMITLSRHP